MLRCSPTRRTPWRTPLLPPSHTCMHAAPSLFSGLSHPPSPLSPLALASGYCIRLGAPRGAARRNCEMSGVWSGVRRQCCMEPHATLTAYEVQATVERWTCNVRMQRYALVPIRYTTIRYDMMRMCVCVCVSSRVRTCEREVTSERANGEAEKARSRTETEIETSLSHNATVRRTRKESASEAQRCQIELLGWGGIQTTREKFVRPEKASNRAPLVQCEAKASRQAHALQRCLRTPAALGIPSVAAPCRSS